MSNEVDPPSYRYKHAGHGHAHQYLLPPITQFIDAHRVANATQRLFDLGCGNGAAANYFAGLGFEVCGIDTSAEGIKQASEAYPILKLELGSAYDDLALTYGSFDFVSSLEVVEHVFFPRKFAATLFALVKPGGYAVISTPYHGYLKNVALAVSGKMDRHFTALWDYGHIKFWSMRTLETLLLEAGFESVKFERVGRVPWLAKSMIAFAKRSRI